MINKYQKIKDMLMCPVCGKYMSHFAKQQLTMWGKSFRPNYCLICDKCERVVPIGKNNEMQTYFPPMFSMLDGY